MGWQRKLIWLTFFALSMGYLESAVVIYLRALYYPGGFSFPIQPLSGNIALTEVLRETATLIMLVSLAFLTGRTLRQRLAWFLYAFAIWDIFYYVFLKLLIGWPDSLLTWDILFLIPVMWTGPVLAPVIVSLTMILLALLLLFSENHTVPAPIMRSGMGLILAGAGVVFIAFIWDYSAYILKQYPVSGLFSNQIIQTSLQHYIPEKFNWFLFLSGEILILAGSLVINNAFRKSSGS